MRSIDHGLIDLANTYATDLQTRLQANKGFLVTIGDGIHSIGDYNVRSSDDLGAVINNITSDSVLKKSGGTIYIKHGVYNLKSITYIRENTHVTGDGPDATKISMFRDYRRSDRGYRVIF